MNILMVGDVVARPGRRVLIEQLGQIQRDREIDFTVVNIENAAGGFGITKKVFDELSVLKIDVMTSGNHIWDKKEALDFIESQPTLLRPSNYPVGTPGSGFVSIRVADGRTIGVINVMGQAFMHPTLDSPYESVDRLIDDHCDQCDVLLVDFHAEATSEKVAMGWHLDGRVGAVVGTHTHIPTADERVLPKGTAYITDLGMTGCYDSVIGSAVEGVLQRMVKKMHARFEPATGPGSLCGVVIKIDSATGLASNIQRLRVEQA